MVIQTNIKSWAYLWLSPKISEQYHNENMYNNLPKVDMPKLLLLDRSGVDIYLTAA